MNTSRRDFLATSLAAGATLAATRAHAAPASPAGGSREHYDVRCYHLKADSRLKTSAARGPRESYLEQAFLPALIACARAIDEDLAGRRH